MLLLLLQRPCLGDQVRIIKYLRTILGNSLRQAGKDWVIKLLRMSEQCNVYAIFVQRVLKNTQY